MGISKLLAAAVLVTLGVVAPAARADILDPDTLSLSGQGAIAARAAITPSGWVLVTWTVAKGEGASQVVQTRGSWRPPAGNFGAPFVLAHGAGVLAATSDDKIVFAWRDTGGVKAELLDPGTSHGPTVTVRPAGIGLMDPVIAADQHGSAIVVTTDNTGTYAARRERGHRIGTTTQVAPYMSQYPVVATNANGDIAIVATRGENFQSVANFLVTAPAGGAFSPPVDVPIDETFGPQVGVTDDGTVAVAGAGTDTLEVVQGPDGYNHIVQHQSTGAVLATKRPGAPFTTQPLNDSGDITAMSAGPNDDLTLLDSQSGALRLRDRHRDGTLSDPTPFTTNDVCFDAAVLAPVGSVMAIGTSCTNPFAGTIALTERPPGGTFSPPVPISLPNSGLPVAAANPAGAIVVAWTHWPRAGSLAHGVVQAVVRDGTSEVSLLTPSRPIDISSSGLIDLPLECTGLKDCLGTLGLVPGAASSRSSLAGGQRTVVQRALSVPRGTRKRLRLRLPSSARRSARATLDIRLKGVRGAAAHRTITVTLRRRSR